jgi:hypothetical protein
MGGKCSARYKQIDTNLRSLTDDLETQFLHDIFDHVLVHLLAQKIDPSPFDARVNDDETASRMFTFSANAHGPY